MTLPTDLFPKNQVGTVSGLAGMGGAVGGMLANLATGYLVTAFSYKPVFAIAGLMHPLAAFLIYRLIAQSPVSVTASDNKAAV
jgi:ACS family hexuronate transporter-like MFS transporter